MIRLPSDEELEHGQAILREMFKLDEPAPEAANVGPLFDLGSTAAWLMPNGEAANFGPTPHQHGYVLHRIMQRIQAMRTAVDVSPDDYARYQADVAEATRIITELARPVSAFARLRKRMGLWKPLRNASDGEIGELLGFLLMYRNRSRIRPLSIRN